MGMTFVVHQMYTALGVPQNDWIRVAQFFKNIFLRILVKISSVICLLTLYQLFAQLTKN